MSDTKQTGARAAGGLTQRQEAFCLAFIETGNASEAYRRAYTVKKMSDKKVWVKASELMSKAKIKERVAGLRTKAADKAVLTLASHLEELARLRDLAKAEKSWASAVQAEVKRGEAAGLYPDRKSVNVSVGLPPSTEPVSETSRWIAGVNGNGRRAAA